MALQPEVPNRWSIMIDEKYQLAKNIKWCLIFLTHLYKPSTFTSHDGNDRTLTMIVQSWLTVCCGLYVFMNWSDMHQSKQVNVMILHDKFHQNWVRSFRDVVWNKCWWMYHVSLYCDPNTEACFSCWPKIYSVKTNKEQSLWIC